MKFLKTKLLLLIVIAIALVFRFNNLNWDSNQHLHPDERFLTMVGNAMEIPTSFQEYIDPKVSKLNPENIGYKFYVYGVTPLTINKLLAEPLDNDSYNGFTIQGRALSGMFDIIVLIFVYKIASLLYSSKKDKGIDIPIWAAFFYAVAVLPIQLSHFFAVDTFLVAFLIMSLYFALRVYFNEQWYDVLLSTLFFGLAMSTKISALYMLPLILVFLLLPWIQNSIHNKKIIFPQIGKSILTVIVFVMGTYSVLRLADPYLFENPNFFNFEISKTFIANIESLKSFEGPDVWFPPAVQWISKPPVTFALVNLAFFGLGIPYFLLTCLGILKILKDAWKVIIHAVQKKFHINFSREKTTIALFIILGWVGLFFIYQSVQFVKAMRYFIVLYPMFALFAALGLHVLITNYELRITKFFKNSKLSLFGKYKVIFIITLVVLIWPVAFSSIYLQKHSRVEASEWIFKNFEDGSKVAWEHWDDPLPLQVEDQYGKIISGEALPVFDQETPEKWQKINEILEKSDYYILSSNRAWGSMPTVPEKYPETTQFYKELFEEKRGFVKIKEFNSYPKISLFNTEFTINDQWSEESFTVYDHPQVIIFKKVK